MTRSELIQELMEVDVSGDPEVTLWVSETEQAVILSVYEDTKNTKIFIDIQVL